jgi:hypothetical protein
VVGGPDTVSHGIVSDSGGIFENYSDFQFTGTITLWPAAPGAPRQDDRYRSGQDGASLGPACLLGGRSSFRSPGDQDGTYSRTSVKVG